MSYKFVITGVTTIDLPFKYQTKNANGTRTPIPLAGKRIELKFFARDVASSILTLDSSTPANAQGSKLEITAAAAGEFKVVIPIAQRPVLAKCHGRWELKLFTGNEPKDLGDGPFSVE